MTDFVIIPTDANQLTVWDANISNTPYSTRWDTIISIWDIGAAIWDAGASIWDGADPETYWVG